MNNKFMLEALKQARYGMQHNHGGPFGAVIVKENKIIGRGYNQVTSSNDPTAHAEVVAIRAACKEINNFQLNDCEIYTSCEPCPMCLCAIYWARLRKIYYAAERHDAAAVGFDDEFFYQEVAKPLENRTIPTESCMRDEVLVVFEEWQVKSDKINY